MQSQRLVIAQKQQLKLSPQMYQSLELMALPIMDLREKIQSEIEKNPALELEAARDISFERVERVERSRGNGTFDPFENSSDPGYIRKSHYIDPDSKHKFIEGALSRPESLQEHLSQQLHFINLTAIEMEIGELLISNLDDQGFYRENPASLIPFSKHQVKDRMIEILREFDPPGICVENFVESLVLQVKLSGLAPAETEAVIRNHLENLKKGKYSDIAKALDIPEQDVDDILRFIKTLNPYPGSNFSREATQYVIPDLLIQKIDSRLVMKLNDEQIPSLTLDPTFEGMAENTETIDKKTEKYIQRSIRDARWLMNSIEMRNSTLRRVGAALLKSQMDFFLKGPKYIRPLTLKDIAEEISVHETTVSRISNAKYIQTDWGIFPIKYFFSNAVTGTGDDGKNVSKTGVKEIVRELIENYSGKKRLSDQKISNMLADRGIKIARRTVAKYRGELNIDSSFGRSP
ncbi:MAG: RNA polymerase factor sigma-54 [Spirochaetales bacterium]|nr:RNA polymerase factor sigma-54 [Spirochaetales bacterium]